MEQALTCRLCGSPNVEELISEEHDHRAYHVIRCAQCDLIQTAEHYAEFSPEYVGLENSALDEDRLWCQGTHKLPAFKQWLAYAARLRNGQNSDRSRRLLDVGCGTGGFLKFASAHGFRVYGFDASQAQAEYVQKLFPDVRRANSIQEYLLLIDQPGMKFDFITLWDVFEHIRNPIQFLQELAGALQPGGQLFLATPNGGAIPWKIRIRRALNKPLDLAPWEHVFYHSMHSLKKSLETASLEPVCFGAVACYPRPFSPFEICRRTGFFLLKAVPRLSPQIFAWAQKPST